VKTTGGAEEEHTIIEIEGRFFQSTTGGAAEFKPSPSDLSAFGVKRHPKGA
jgi:hypothetical protein